MKLYLYLFIALLSLGSCTVELPLPEGSVERKIALVGELAGDDTVLIRAGQSTPISSSGGQPALIQQLAVAVKDAGGLTLALQERQDIASYSLFTLPFTSASIITPGTTYSISATHPELGSVSASVEIPKAFVAKLVSKSFVGSNNDTMLQMDIDINDPNASSSLYVIEAVKQSVYITGYFTHNATVYTIDDNRNLYDSLKALSIPVSEYYDTSYSGNNTRTQLYSTDHLADNSIGTGQGKLLRRVFLKGSSFGSKTHRTTILIRKSDLVAFFEPAAQTRVYIKSVASAYYDFLKAYENYDPSAGIGGNANPTRLPGNVVGGYGMIGGVYRQYFEMIY
jgi:hypothetical protein